MLVLVRARRRFHSPRPRSSPLPDHPGAIRRRGAPARQMKRRRRSLDAGAAGVTPRIRQHRAASDAIVRSTARASTVGDDDGSIAGEVTLGDGVMTVNKPAR